MHLLAYAKKPVVGCPVIVILILDAWFSAPRIVVWRVKDIAGDENVLVDVQSQLSSQIEDAVSDGCGAWGHGCGQFNAGT